MRGSGLSRKDAFLIVYRDVRSLRDAVKSLAKSLESDPRAAYMFSAERGGAEYSFTDLDFDHVHPRIAEVEGALRSTLLEVLGSEIIHDVEIALRETKNVLPLLGEIGGDARILAEAVDWFESSVQRIDDYCYQQAIAVYGVEVARLFSAWNYYLLDGANDLDEQEVNNDYLVRLMLNPAPSDAEQVGRDAIAARNRWVYEQVMAGVRYPEIIELLSDESRNMGWPRVSSVPGIKGIAERYAKDNGLPLPPKRSPGRPGGL